MESLSIVPLTGVTLGGHLLSVNRAVIRHRDERALVYYFFKQRQRILTDGYAANWFLFWDAIVRGRTDGALVRLMTTVRDGETVDVADGRLAAFAGTLSPQLGRFLPD